MIIHTLLYTALVHSVHIGQLVWPSLADVNTRARRLVSAWLKQQKREEQKQLQLLKVRFNILFQLLAGGTLYLASLQGLPHSLFIGFMFYTEHKLMNKIQGRSGNEATL